MMIIIIITITITIMIMIIIFIIIIIISSSRAELQRCAGDLHGGLASKFGVHPRSQQVVGALLGGSTG